MKIYYNIITGFLLAIVAILPAGEMQFTQCENSRGELVDVETEGTRYYLQYDSDEPAFRVVARLRILIKTEIIINIVPPRFISRGIFLTYFHFMTFVIFNPDWIGYL